MIYWFITGTSKGLGNAIAQLLLEQPHNNVTGLSRSATIEHAQYAHNNIDLSDKDAVMKFMFPEVTNADKIVLINNAASLGEIKYCGDLSDELIVQTHMLNIITPHILINKFIAAYNQNKAEKIIVNITSGAANSPYDGWSIYGTSKAGMDMLTRIADMEMQLRKTNIRVYGIAPGVLDTDMQSAIRNTSDENFQRKEKFVELHNEKALRSPKEAAQKIIHLIKHPENISGIISKLS